MSSRAFATAKFKWIEAITCDHGLLAVDVRVATALLRYFNEKDQDGRAFPSCQTLATKIGVNETTVIRSVRRMHARGHLMVVWGKAGRGYPNQYWMAPGKPAPTQVFQSAKPASDDGGKPASDENKTCVGAGDSRLSEPVEKEGCLTAPLPSLSERDAQTGCATLARGDGGGGLTAPHIASEAPPGARLFEEEEARPLDGEVLPPVASSLDGKTSLDDLRAVWARGWAKDDTPAAQARIKAAWARAVTTTDPTTILDAARAWVAAADAPRFLPRLVDWLDGRGWQAEPPKKRGRNFAGGRRRKRGGGGGRVDLAEMMMRKAHGE